MLFTRSSPFIDVNMIGNDTSTSESLYLITESDGLCTYELLALSDVQNMV